MASGGGRDSSHHDGIGTIMNRNLRGGEGFLRLLPDLGTRRWERKKKSCFSKGEIVGDKLSKGREIKNGRHQTLGRRNGSCSEGGNENLPPFQKKEDRKCTGEGGLK